PSREPERVTWLPRCSATTPSRRSISARFCPYWPNSRDASRFSSKASTIWVAAVSPAADEDTKDSLSDREERNRSDLHQYRFCGHIDRSEGSEQTVGADYRDPRRYDVADHCRWRHDLNRLQIWGAPDDLARMTSRLFEQDVEDAATASRIERGLLSLDSHLQATQPLGFD